MTDPSRPASLAPEAARPVRSAAHTGEGIALMVLGAGILTVNDAFIKLVIAAFPLGPALFLRIVFAILFLSGYLALRGRLGDLRWTNLRDQILCGLTMGASIGLFIYSLRTLPIGTAIVLVYLSPLIVTALAPLLLREKVGWHRRIAVAFGFAGAVIIVRPGSAAFEPAMLAALLAAVAGAARDILIRRMTATESSVSILMMSLAVCFVLFLPWGLAEWEPAADVPWLYLLLSALTFAVAQVVMNESLRRADASVASPFKYSGVVYAGLLGYFIWGDVPDVFFLAGAAMIIGSGLFVALRESGGAGRRR